MRWLAFLLFWSAPALGQQMLQGKIVDAHTGHPVPFASIGLVGTNKGTSSNLNGEFSMPIEGKMSLKVTCIGYESLVLESAQTMEVIRLTPSTTQLAEVFVYAREIDPQKIVRKAFQRIPSNYANRGFVQTFFYRHYCKDDSVYGRLIEASVDVWKRSGYRVVRHEAGTHEEIRVTQLRRSLDNTAVATGHPAISVTSVLQADIVAYQTLEKTLHQSYFTEVSNLNTDFDSYYFTFKGTTRYDDQEVYTINYEYKLDSVLTSFGYVVLPKAHGTLYITTKDHAIIKTEDVKTDGSNVLRSTALFRKHNNRYYPYHLIREGESIVSGSGNHQFHIELMSAEVNPEGAKFTGRPMTKEELMNIPYDSVFWNSGAVLKTTPLEDKIIEDIGRGIPLSKQFELYKAFEVNVANGGVRGEEKFFWYRQFQRGRKHLYVAVWKDACLTCMMELDRIKQLNKVYRDKIAFVFVSLEDDEKTWREHMSKYNLFADGIVNYRVGSHSPLAQQFKNQKTPFFLFYAKDGEDSGSIARSPVDPLLRDELEKLAHQSQ